MLKKTLIFFVLALFAMPLCAEWKATVTDKEREGDQIRIVVWYSDGTTSFNRSYRYDGSREISVALADDVKAQLGRLLKQLKAAYKDEYAPLIVGLF